MSGPYKRGAAFAVCLPAISPGRDKSLPYEYFVWNFFGSFFVKKEQNPR